MALYTIADLHLPLGIDKPMDIFGKAWENYVERLADNWQSVVKKNDVVVLPGDFSWATYLEQSVKDFEYLHKLNGKKILLKGNHDYWWSTKKKMDDFLIAEGCRSIEILHNNHFRYENYGICGTRGWVSIKGETTDEKVLKREVQRLETSIKSALAENLQPIVFMHYPPIFATNFNYDILDVLYRYNIKDCYYGHIHGRSAHELCIKNTYDGINFHLIAGDYLQFIPEKVL